MTTEISRPATAPVQRTGNESMSPTSGGRLTDAEWEAAVARVKKEVDRYSHVDVRALAEQGAREYLRERDASASATPAALAETGFARAMTAAMAYRLESRHSVARRFRGFVLACAAFLLPPVIAVLVLAIGGAEVGWSTLPSMALRGIYGFLVLITLGLAARHLLASPRAFFTESRYTGIIAGMLVVIALLPPAIRLLRDTEIATLRTATTQVERGIADYMARKAAGQPVQVPAIKDPQNFLQLKRVAGGLNEQYVADATGLPGVLRAVLERDHGAIYWSRPGQADMLKARIALGGLSEDNQGALTLKTATTVYGPLRLESAGMRPVAGPVAAVLDPEGVQLLSIQPVPARSPTESVKPATP
jgi:hypothetical protein